MTERVRGLVAAVLLVLVGLAPASATAATATLKRGATPDPGSHAAKLAALIEHPSLRPNAPRPMSPRVSAAMTAAMLGYHRRAGRRPSRDAALIREATATWERLRPAIAARHGVDLAPNLRVLAGGRRGFVASALPDGSIVVNRSAMELASSLARAVAAADGDADKLLANLTVVARAMRKNQHRVTFGKVNAARYRAALDGALIGLLGHELGHVVMEHAALDISQRSRTLRQPAALDRRKQAYFGARAARPFSGQDLVDGRPLFYAQDQEADADRIAVDLAQAVGAEPDGLMADLLTYVLLDGMDRPPVGAHPPSLFRFDDGRTRYRRAGVATIVDGITRDDLRRAIDAAHAP